MKLSEQGRGQRTHAGRRRRTILAVGVLSTLVASQLSAATLSMTTTERVRLEQLGERLPTARLLWVRNSKIYHSPIANFAEQRLTTGANEEESPHWSPDGSKIVFTRLPRGVWVMNADFSNPRLVIPTGVIGTWTRDGTALTAIDAAHPTRVLKHVLSTGQTTTIYDSTDAAYAGKWAAGDELSSTAELRSGDDRYLLTFTVNRGVGNTHHTYIVDLLRHEYIYNEGMARGDCQPVWAPDGSYVIQTARLSPSRPLYKSVFRPDANPPRFEAAAEFFGLHASVCAGCSTYYNHGEHISNDGQWLVTGGDPKDGPDEDNYELYIWKIGESWANAVRVTFDDVRDRPADLYVFPEPVTPALELSPNSLSFTATAGGHNPSNKTVAVVNDSTGTLSEASVSESAGWLTVTRSGAGDNQTLTNAVDSSGLTAGNYSERVIVSCDNAGNSPRTYRVELIVHPPPDAGLADDLGWQHDATVDLPDANRPDTEMADTAQADTEQADADQADTQQADTEQADTQRADTEQADTQQADTDRADTEQADTQQADRQQADTEQNDQDQRDQRSEGVDAELWSESTGLDAGDPAISALKAVSMGQGWSCAAAPRQALGLHCMTLGLLLLYRRRGSRRSRAASARTSRPLQG